MQNKLQQRHPAEQLFPISSASVVFIKIAVFMPSGTGIVNDYEPF